MTGVPTYFDACSLVYRAEGKAPGCGSMAAGVGPIVEAHLLNPSRRAFVSDLTVLEFRNTLSKLCRATSPSSKCLDAGWMSDNVTDLMKLVADGTVEVLETRPRAPLQASELVDLAARSGSAFGTWDTIHILNAAALAHERGRAVDLVTSDKGLAKFVRHYGHFGPYVNVVQIDDPAA